MGRMRASIEWLEGDLGSGLIRLEEKSEWRACPHFVNSIVQGLVAALSDGLKRAKWDNV